MSWSRGRDRTSGEKQRARKRLPGRVAFLSTALTRPQPPAQEIDELVAEWTPEPLLPPARQGSLPPIIVGPIGPRPRVIFPTAGQSPHDPVNPMSLEGGKVVLNLASSNFSEIGRAHV